MTDLDAIRARAANIATGSVYSQQQTAADYQALLGEIDRRTTDLIAEQSVRQDEWDHASELLKDGVKSVSHWEQQTVAARAERDRYRLAWQHARKRSAELESDMRHYEETVIGDLNERNTRDCRRAARAEAQVARVRAFLEDMATWCSPHGIAADYSRRGLDALDGIDPLGLAGPTRGEQPQAVPGPGEVHQQAGGFNGGEAWMWRCNGTQWCDGWIGLDLGSEAAARAEYERHARECHHEQPTEKQLHRRLACPGWEYATTEGPRKQWDDVDRPPEGDGWERNVDAGRDGWERFDYTEEAYWRRRVVSAPR